MKSFIRSILALSAFAVLAHWHGAASAQPVYSELGGFFGGMEQHAVLTINADGSCLAVNETIESRKAAEQQVRLMERFKNMAEAGDENAAAADLSATNTTQPFTDEELSKKITDTMSEQADQAMADSGQKLSVDVKKDTVVLTATRSFASIKDMLANSDAIWNQAGVNFSNARFEIDTNGLLRVTFTPSRGMERYLKTARSEWKLSGMKMELKLLFPGNVVSSGLPETQTNATWLTVNATNDASLDALAELYAAPTVITAEAGGLKLDQPLESRSLRSLSRGRGEVGEDLPVTEAGTGFVAQAQNISTTTRHIFPGGEDYFEENGGSFGLQTGVVVNAKLFAPRGRTMLSVSGVHVLSAADDKGRSVPADEEDDEDFQSAVYSSGGSADADSMQVQLHLQLPQPDAQAIDKLSAEAVAVTAGSWQELTLTNLQENATNEFDLSALLPGTKLLITKFSSKNNQVTIQARLQGPGTIQRLDVRAKIPGSDNFNSYSSESHFNIQDGQATRALTIQGYGFSDQAGASPVVPVLVVRYPNELRREHVKFSLKGLDLL